MIGPKLRKRALTAHRLSKKGLKGKAIGEKLKCSTDEANQLAAIGGHLLWIEASTLTDAEKLLIKTLGDLQLSNLNNGATGSPKGDDVSWLAQKGSSWAAATTKRRLREPRDLNQIRWPHEKAIFGFVAHSINGHMWLTRTGWAVWALMAEVTL